MEGNSAHPSRPPFLIASVHLHSHEKGLFSWYRSLQKSIRGSLEVTMASDAFEASGAETSARPPEEQPVHLLDAAQLQQLHHLEASD